MHILVVDDHTLFRQGVTFLLSDLDKNLRFLEAGSCEQALGLLQVNTVDLILLDLNMPGSDGLEALIALVAAAPTAPVAILSGDEDPAVIRATIEAGASGYVSKSSTSDILVAALKLILAGGIYLPKNALNDIDSAQTQNVVNSSAEKPVLLSQRQTAVLLRAIQGRPNKSIANDLGIAEGTVKAHLSAAFKVLGVRNRTEAVFAAASLGLQPPSISMN